MKEYQIISNMSFSYDRNDKNHNNDNNYNNDNKEKLILEIYYNDSFYYNNELNKENKNIIPF